MKKTELDERSNNEQFSVSYLTDPNLKDFQKCY